MLKVSFKSSKHFASMNEHAYSASHHWCSTVNDIYIVDTIMNI